MPWVYQKVKDHKCATPFDTSASVSSEPDMKPGDVWQCPDCLSTYKVKFNADQRDGDYYTWNKFDSTNADTSKWHGYLNPLTETPTAKAADE